MSLTAAQARVDIRLIPPRERHPLIFSAFRHLAGGQVMELIDDHDPRPLYHQFQAEMPGKFAWEYLEKGPQTWHVVITKLKAHADGQCCGSCGGA